MFGIDRYTISLAHRSLYISDSKFLSLLLSDVIVCIVGIGREMVALAYDLFSVGKKEPKPFQLIISFIFSFFLVV